MEVLLDKWLVWKWSGTFPASPIVIVLAGHRALFVNRVEVDPLCRHGVCHPGPLPEEFLSWVD